MTFTHALSTNNYGPAKFIVSTSAATGTHTTITSAVTAASSGDTVFIRDGTYTEDIAMKPGVFLASFGDSATSQANIVGKITFPTAGAYKISNVNITTNNDFCLLLDGTDALNIELSNVLISCANSVGISITNSNASTVMVLFYSILIAGPATEALYNISGPVSLAFYHCVTATQGGTTAATNSNGSASFYNCVMATPHAVSGTGLFNISECRLDTSSLNTTCIDASGTSTANIFMSEIFSGTAPCVSIGVGSTSTLSHVHAASSNTNVFTGAGGLNYAFITFGGSSSGHNVTSENPLNTLI